MELRCGSEGPRVPCRGHRNHPPHLRDTHASLLAESGVLEVISRPLGDSSIAITMDRYMHVSKQRDADAAEAFEKLIG